MTQVIAAWFREDAKDQASWYPQVGSDSSLPRFQKVYWRCVPAFYATSRRFNPDAELRFYTNARLPVVDGVNIAEVLSSLNVEIINIPYAHLPPIGYFGQWRNQFFVLDILQHLALDEVDAAIVLDTDCVFTGSTKPLFDLLNQEGAATYVVATIAASPETASNGLTGAELSSLSSEIVGRALKVPYCGGEIVALRGDVLADVARRADELWHDSQKRHLRGDIKFNEEAQLLSCVYADLGLPVGLAEPFIRRIWTQRSRDVDASDRFRPIWHLPGEKHYGFRQLVPKLRNTSSWFWTDDNDSFSRHLSLAMGVPHRGRRKWVRDHLDYATRKTSERLARVHTGRPW